MTWRPTRQQFYTYGLRAECCTAEARQIETVDFASSPAVFELRGHGLADGAVGRFRAEGDPKALATGLSASSTYEVTTNGGDLFTVSLAGAPVDLTDEGTGVLTWIQDLGPEIDAHLDASVSYLEDNARAYAPPFADPVRLTVIEAVCQRAAYNFAVTLRNSSPAFSLEDLRKRFDDAQALIARLNAGETLVSDPIDATPDVEEAAAVPFQDFDADGRGWLGTPGEL